MPLLKKKPLLLSEEYRRFLQKVSQSRTEQVRRVERANILLHYADGMKSSAIAARLQISIPSVDKCINKALQFGVHQAQALEDFKRSGRPVELTDLFGKASSELLMEHTTPEEILELDTGELAAFLSKHSRGKLGRSKAEEIQTAALNSFGIDMALDAFRIQVKMLIQQIKLAEEHLQLLNTAITENWPRLIRT